ncbi:PDT-domain-containing protein [Schizophyllum commune Loenen D]|nr:PDT-domain-containing protein [Schizophyllum commune Loenen D]
MDAATPTVAYLGPSGTYSHQAAYERFGPNVAYVEQRTITDVFNAVASKGAIGVVPQENTIFGAVVETYDALAARMEQVFVRGIVTLAVQHCLLAKTGTRLEDIDTVVSHEQALGQCREFLRTRLPKARLVGAPSTAAAARDVLAGPSTSAAIGSKLCAMTFPGLSVLRQSIQAESNNFTRFYTITRESEIPLPEGQEQEDNDRYALLAITPGPGQRISHVLQALSLDAVRMDRRPAPNAPPFQDTYLLEVTEAGATEWRLHLDQALDRVRTTGATVSLMGIW